MQPRTHEVIDYLDRHRTDLERAVASIPEPQRHRRSAESSWSVAEILEHLVIVEGGIARRLGAEIAKARDAGLGPERDATPVVSSVPVEQLLDRSAPIVAREAALPSGRVPADEAWRELQATRSALRAALLDADGLALSEVVLPHPRLGPLNVYQWLVFVGAHEGRHAAQVRATAPR